MSTDLVTIQSHQIDTGLDDVAPLRPSYLRFLQPSSSNLHGGEPGQFYDEVTQDVYSELTVVPLQVTTNRILYPPDAEIKSGVKPLCRSDDGKTPSRYVEHPQSRSCFNCQYSQWVDNKPSKCSVNLKLLCLMKDKEAPRYIVAMGTSVSPMRAMLRKINEDLKAENLKGNPVQIYDYYFKVSSERKRNYFVMKFEGEARVRDLGAFSKSFLDYVRMPSVQQTTSDAVDAEIVNEI